MVELNFTWKFEGPYTCVASFVNSSLTKNSSVQVSIRCEEMCSHNDTTSKFTKHMSRDYDGTIDTIFPVSSYDGTQRPAAVYLACLYYITFSSAYNAVRVACKCAVLRHAY